MHQSPSITKERQGKKKSLYKCELMQSAVLPHAPTYIRDVKLFPITQAGNLRLPLGDEVIVVDVV